MLYGYCYFTRPNVAADFLYGEGLLSGETEAVVESWKAVVKVKA